MKWFVSCDLNGRVQCFDIKPCWDLILAQRFLAHLDSRLPLDQTIRERILLTTFSVFTLGCHMHQLGLYISTVNKPWYINEIYIFIYSLFLHGSQILTLLLHWTLPAWKIWRGVHVKWCLPIADQWLKFLSDAKTSDTNWKIYMKIHFCKFIYVSAVINQQPRVLLHPS